MCCVNPIRTTRQKRTFFPRARGKSHWKKRPNPRVGRSVHVGSPVLLAGSDPSGGSRRSCSTGWHEATRERQTGRAGHRAERLDLLIGTVVGAVVLGCGCRVQATECSSVLGST